MTDKKFSVALIGLFLFCMATPGRSAMPKEEVYSLFNQANQFFREANTATDDPDKAQKLDEKAILNYEKIISDGRIKNSKLYYNLGNAYFLKEDIGRAILNYRRAENLDKGRHNV
jgi:tetratricopeptide (TPR) repeat protein